jgi:hypothetical protein
VKPVTRQKLTRGWNEKKVRDLIAYYDNQTEEEGAAEIETAPEAPGETWISVPTALVPAVARLIENHQRKKSNRASHRPTVKARSTSSQERAIHRRGTHARNAKRRPTHQSPTLPSA